MGESTANTCMTRSSAMDGGATYGGVGRDVPRELDCTAEDPQKQWRTARPCRGINLDDFREEDVIIVRGKGRKERLVIIGEYARAARKSWLPIQSAWTSAPLGVLSKTWRRRKNSMPRSGTRTYFGMPVVRTCMTITRHSSSWGRSSDMPDSQTRRFTRASQ